MALNASTGIPLWQQATADGGLYSPVLDKAGNLYVGSITNAESTVGGFMYCLDAKDGSVKWRFPTGGWVSAAALSGRGTVLFGSADGFVYALE